MLTYRKLTPSKLTENYFSTFKHEQRWTHQWVKNDNTWELVQVDASRSWTSEKRVWIAQYLKEQICRGGVVIGAFQGGQIVGFACVDGKIIEEYANLTMLFVDDEFKGKWIGSELFRTAQKEAQQIGAKKLFISAIPSEETIAFYFSRGCKDAEKFIPDFADSEKDRYLEIVL